MYNNDYIIAVDENGQPFIAHANGVGTWLNRAVKYIQKVPNGKGGFRYIYDRAKASAKKAWGSKAGRWIDEHDAGLSERAMSKLYGAKKRRAQKSGDHDLASYYSKRQQGLKYEGRREGKAAKEAVKRKYNSAKERAKDWAGYDERERRNAANTSATIAERNYWQSKNKYGPNKGEGSKTRALHDVATQQRQAARDRQAEYDKTLLGLLERIDKRRKKKNK